MCENWGYFRLAGYYRKESIEEMVHAEKLMNRILFLEGTPSMTDIGPIKVGKNLKAQLENDLVLELDAVKHLNGAIQNAVEANDNASRALFEEILNDEEEHVDYLEGQSTRSARSVSRTISPSSFTKERKTRKTSRWGAL